MEARGCSANEVQAWQTNNKERQMIPNKRQLYAAVEFVLNTLYLGSC